MRNARGPRLRRPHLNKPAHSFARHVRRSRFFLLVPLLTTLPFFIATVRSILRTTDSLQTITHPLQDGTHHNSNTKTRRNTTSITIAEYLRLQTRRRTYVIPPDGSISLIAACMNRPQSLSLSLPSWEAIPQIQQIVLVDWSSPTVYESPLITNLTQTGRLSLIRVQNANSWILSRAYNLAAKFATGEYIIKVDCDTHLDAAFLSHQPVPPRGGYYTSVNGGERDNNEKKLRGVWFGHSDNFRAIGGYDERIVGYGYEDTDLYKRFNEFLDELPLDLDYVRHNTAGDIVIREMAPKKISLQLNEAYMKNVSRWSDAIGAGNVSRYEYCYDDHTNILYATIVDAPRAAMEELSARDVVALKTAALGKSLHDDYNIPHDMVASLHMSDMEFLAGYLDNDQPGYVIITVLQGVDTLSNIFNLISALQVGITTGRPVVTLWPTKTESATPILRHLLDINATNERLQHVVKSVTARLHGFSKVSRLIPAAGCIAEHCVKDDKAYDMITEVEVPEMRVFDEYDPLPLPLRQHALLRLGNGTKLGGGETRALAYGCISFRDNIISALHGFDRTAVVADSGLNYTAVAGLPKGRVPVVGPASTVVRKVLSVGYGFCDRICGSKEMVMEVANVVAVVLADRVLPKTACAREDWEDGFDVAGMMVCDLRSLYRRTGLRDSV